MIFFIIDIKDLSWSWKNTQVEAENMDIKVNWNVKASY